MTLSAQGSTTWVRALELDDLWEGDMTGVEVDGQKVLLVNNDGDVKAFENKCPHQDWALDEGDYDGEKITCSRHHWEFDSSTGAGVNPTDCTLRAFGCRVTDGTIEVELP